MNTDFHLVAADGASVALSVVDYQFASGDNWYDLNWLVIAGAVANGKGTWSFQDPCLLTTEATLLGHWLVRSANRTLEVERLDFIEPNLAVDRLSIDDDTVVLRIEFDLEARPPFADSDGPYVVDLPVPAQTCASMGRWGRRGWTHSAGSRPDERRGLPPGGRPRGLQPSRGW